MHMSVTTAAERSQHIPFIFRLARQWRKRFINEEKETLALAFITEGTIYLGALWALPGWNKHQRRRYKRMDTILYHVHAQVDVDNSQARSQRFRLNYSGDIVGCRFICLPAHHRQQATFLETEDNSNRQSSTSFTTAPWILIQILWSWCQTNWTS